MESCLSEVDLGQEFALLMRLELLELRLSREVEKHVGQLEVPMNDAALVNFVDALDYLAHDESRLILT